MAINLGTVDAPSILQAADQKRPAHFMGSLHTALVMTPGAMGCFFSRRSHDQNFFELIRFLFGPDSRLPEIERDFLDFGGMMLSKETPKFEVLGCFGFPLSRICSGTRRRSLAGPAFATASAPELYSHAAQWLACELPYRRFAVTLAGHSARLRADAVRYSFIVPDSHRLLLADLPSHCEK